MPRRGVGKGGAPCKHGVSAYGFCAKKPTRSRKDAMLAVWAAKRAAGTHRRGPTGKQCKHGKYSSGYCKKKTFVKRGMSLMKKLKFRPQRAQIAN